LNLSRWPIRTLTTAVVLLLLCVRAAFEWCMMRSYGPDAQMAIWLVFCLAELAFWAILGSLIGWILVKCWPDRERILLGITLMMFWVACIGVSSFAYYQGWRALEDAVAPSTSPERLNELSNFQGIQAGYELDNRIATHPNTPPETLRKLHQRNQLGTNYCLAKNPNTPADVIQSLSQSDDQWVQQELSERRKQENPASD
jgi:hypothetical protein